FVCFEYDKSGITAKIDCRSGGDGVRLGGRTLKLCTFVFEHYDLPPYESLCAYCRKICDNPILPDEKIYGGNNWYYAYGDSSYDQIVSDAALQAQLAKGIENRPFMVVDDGWQKNGADGLIEPNEQFGDMKALAGEMKTLGVRPGIWIRLLENDSEAITPDMRILRNGERVYLDPTNKKVQTLIKQNIERIKAWGYELIKHDFSTFDMFGDFGKDLTDTITNYDGWHFEDESKTNAEIVKDFYNLIKEACGSMLIIGCNTISHLCAGFVHINRTGDDTSGREWARTRKMGVNTLAFRLAQNEAFYIADADCVGILDNSIPWNKNSQWLDLLSKSNTALFISCAYVTQEQRSDIKKAYFEAQKDHKIKPVDIYDNLTPAKWKIDESNVTYNWD
ncbi:MAG: alpha-galactosidase, partial [Clostridia bacterium]|nr:alpha-galactosidase [Clostridia bacterium]